MFVARIHHCWNLILTSVTSSIHHEVEGVFKNLTLTMAT